VVIDCLTLWVSNVLLSLPGPADGETVVAERTAELLRMSARHSEVGPLGLRCSRRWIVVSNEVGLGVVPPTALGRQFEDALGRANQLVAAAAREVTFMIAGVTLPLKSR
jgi:adenosylcobinamide kinase / adenosylcobinamide-phosphate guanylyltransferase